MAFFTNRRYILFAILVVSLQALLLFLLGQPPICTCGYIKLWEGVVLGPGNSQHLTDWYTFSHIIHGFLFYWLLSLMFPKTPVLARLLMAVGIESTWEVVENTPMVIQHYREQALAQGYTGASIIYSVSDTVTMVVGFLKARRLPVWSIIVLAVGLELFTAYMIRDILTFNVINLLHQFPAIEAWQAGG